MPQTKSAKKTLRNQKRKRLMNLPFKKALGEVISLAKKKPTKENVAKAIKTIDRSATKKIINKGRASRIKSRLSKKLNKA